MPVPLPILRALDLYTRTVWNLGYLTGHRTVLDNASDKVPIPPLVPLQGVIYAPHPAAADFSSPELRAAHYTLLSQLEGGQPAPESPKKPAPFIASASMPASPTNHPDILRADIADLLDLCKALLIEGGIFPEPGTARQLLLARCRAHIQEL